MKKLFLLMGIAAMGIVQYVSAQTVAPAQTAPQGQMMPGKNMTPEDRAKMQSDRMAKDLNLSADVQKKVYDINLKYSKMRDDMMKSGTSREEMQPKVKQMMTDRDNDLKGVLTDDQFKTYKAKATQMRPMNGGQQMQKPEGQ